MAWHRLALLFSVLVIALLSHISPGSASNFTIENACNDAVWPVFQTRSLSGVLSTGFSLQKNESKDMYVPDGWVGTVSVWGRTNCIRNLFSGAVSCQTGDCGSNISCSSPGTPRLPVTLAVFSLNALMTMDLYEASTAAGFNLPMMVIPQGGTRPNCSLAGCSADPCRQPFVKAYNYVSRSCLCNGSLGYRIVFCPQRVKSKGLVMSFVELVSSDAFQRYWPDVFMLIAIALASILLLGFLRKSSSNTLLNFFLWVAYSSIPSIIPYVLGLFLQVRAYQYELCAIWGAILVAVLVSCSNLSAFMLEDNEGSKRLFGEFVLYCAWVGGLFGRSPSLSFRLSMYLFLVLMERKIVSRLCALQCASKSTPSEGVAEIVTIVADYMAFDKRQTNEATELYNPSRSMTEYSYLVGIKDLRFAIEPPFYIAQFGDGDDVVTTAKIWQCEGALLRGDTDDQLKDTCLSFALFLLLLRRYVDVPLIESNLTKTWNFVRHGLMPVDVKRSGDRECERPFRVIEVELSFMYDYFYTQNFYFYLSGLRSKFIQLLVMVVVYFCFVRPTLLHYDPPDGVLRLGGDPIEVLITRIIIYAVIIFDVFHMATIVLSDWYKVKWVCLYVRKKLWRGDSYLKRVIERVCMFSPKMWSKPWKRELGQYSLLESHGYVSLRRRLLLWLLPFKVGPEVGRKASKSTPLSSQVKRAIILSLETNGKRVVNGIASLQRNRVKNELEWAVQQESQTHVILVWHIATSYCEHKHNGGYNNDFLVATSLSRYCAFLVAFAPELLPDPPAATETILSEVVKEANSFFKDCSSMESKWDKMSRYAGNDDRILHRGIRLGKSLAEIATVWKILAEFWAELILFLAPSDNVTAHIKHLSDGGEFITHLWALLTHAGIICRE